MLQTILDTESAGIFKLIIPSHPASIRRMANEGGNNNEQTCIEIAEVCVPIKVVEVTIKVVEECGSGQQRTPSNLARQAKLGIDRHGHFDTNWLDLTDGELKVKVSPGMNLISLSGPGFSFKHRTKGAHSNGINTDAIYVFCVTDGCKRRTFGPAFTVIRTSWEFGWLGVSSFRRGSGRPFPTARNQCL